MRGTRSRSVSSTAHRGNGKHKPKAITRSEKLRRVRSLQRYLNAYGRGSDGREKRLDFARRVGTTLPYLVHLVLGNRTASMDMAIRIEKATYGEVSAEELHPSDAWDYVRRTTPPPPGASQ